MRSDPSGGRWASTTITSRSPRFLPFPFLSIERSFGYMTSQKNIFNMATKLASKPLSLSGGVDSRKASRDARVRPWLTNSVLRGHSPVVGVAVCKDAPLQLETTTVTIVTDPAPTAIDQRVSEKQSASKIPVLSRRCQSVPSDKVGVQGKDKQTATPSTPTGMATSASRIPVRINSSLAGRRPAPLQVRPSEPVLAHAGLPADKEVGKKRGTGGLTVRTVIVSPPAAMSIQKCINLEPIRSHRSDIRVKSILKHRAKPSEETSTRCPLDSTGQGVTPEPGQKKSVTFTDELEVHTLARPWPMDFVPSWTCRVCDGLGHKVWCVTLKADRRFSQDIDNWLAEQGARGHNYLESSGGFLSCRGLDPLVPILS